MTTGTGGATEPRVLVLAGGLSYERDVSLRSGRRVLDALRAAGIDAMVCDVDAALLPSLAADPPNAVVIALHGAAGEDGSLQAILDLCGIPYVGGDAQAARLAWDKPTAKSVLREAGIATPDWVALPQERFTELGAGAVLDRLLSRFDLPLMVKPAQGGSALGARVIRSAAELPAAMVSCLSYADTVLLEPYVEGVEVSVSVVELGAGPVALPAVEIVPTSGVFDFAARYTAGMTTYHTPARLPAAAADAVADAAVRAHQILGLRDLSRTDAIVTADGAVQFLEVNVSPGMTATSLLPMSIEAAGLGLGEVIATLLERAASR
jgi:D-alanine-D-alanine ligase